MDGGELLKLDIEDLQRLLGSRQISPAELVEASLARIEAADPELNACTVVLADEARARAREAERALTRGEPRGALHGIPVAIKDAIWVKGHPATMGTRALESFRPGEDAASVRRLRRAGAIIVAKTTNAELLWDGYTATDLHGVSRNPWDPRLTPGGSSGGSGAAVASGMVPLALGTDAGGSIRIPAAYCGVVGFKPSHGLVARCPGFDEMRSVNHIGPLARSVAGARICLGVIAGHDPADDLSAPIRERRDGERRDPERRRIAYTETLGEHPLDRRTREQFRVTIGELERAGWPLEQASPEVPDLGEIDGPILLTELPPQIAGRERLLSPRIRELLAPGEALSARDYHAAQLARARLARRIDSFLHEYDGLLTPTTAMPPFAADPRGRPIEIDGVSVDIDRDIRPYNFTVLANLIGAPAVSLPAGVDRDGLPFAVQLICRRFCDAACLELAARLSEALPPARLAI